MDRSYICGFGKNPPTQPHHRNATLRYEDSGKWHVFEDTSKPNANTIVGAMVGGPGIDDKFTDDRMNHETNEVALDYNAAFFLGLIQCVATRFE